jgi:hypothetical protein
MKQILKIVLLSMLWFYIFACDADLFKTEDETEPPNVSEIESTAPGFTLNIGDTAKFWITATDPNGKPLTYKWDKNGGEFVSTSDGSEVTWRAPFRGGDYAISISVSNGDKQVAKNRIVRVISSERPVVRILKPLKNEYIVQYENYTFQVEAFHDNGISIVKLYVNDIFIGNMNVKPANIFDYQWIVDAPAGAAKIKVLAEASSVGTLNEDTVSISIEGVIPGKK